MKLTSPTEVRAIMERHGISFNKGYGQNFLINDAIPPRIAEACGAAPEDGILEIGPGIGTLTAELCRRYRKVVSVEIDERLIPALAETTSAFDNLTIIHSDILKVDLARLTAEHFEAMRVSVCANLPYYITTPIIMSLLESGIHFSHITVMVQKEVAARLCSAPGEAAYGSVTASVRRYGTVTRLFSVSAGSFMPAPKVDSAVIRISPYQSPVCHVEDEVMMGRVIRGSFAKRRKTIVNSLASEFRDISREKIAAIVTDAGYAPNVRGETLDVADFAKLSDGFSALLRRTPGLTE